MDGLLPKARLSGIFTTFLGYPDGSYGLTALLIASGLSILKMRVGGNRFWGRSRRKIWVWWTTWGVLQRRDAPKDAAPTPKGL